MRALIMTGGPWSADERAAILAYCEEDVLALERLLPAMLPEITSSSQRLGWALLRGRYMAAVARMEWNGVPIDVETLSRLQDNWATIKDGLIAEVDRDFGVYEGRSFRSERFERYLSPPWHPVAAPRERRLALDDDTFRQQAKAYPAIAPLRELRHTPVRTAVERASGRPRRAQPDPALAVSFEDRAQPTEQLEVHLRPVGVAARSHQAAAGQGDRLPRLEVPGARYRGRAVGRRGVSGTPMRPATPIWRLPRQAGLAPPEATKDTHAAIRQRCKTIVLGVQYGMSAEGMAARTGLHVVEAREILLRHKDDLRTVLAMGGAEHQRGPDGGSRCSRGSAGRSGWASGPTPIRARSSTGRCRPTAPR